MIINHAVSLDRVVVLHHASSRFGQYFQLLLLLLILCAQILELRASSASIKKVVPPACLHVCAGIVEMAPPAFHLFVFPRLPRATVCVMLCVDDYWQSIMVYQYNKYDNNNKKQKRQSRAERACEKIGRKTKECEQGEYSSDK